ncbi:MAG: DUF481 domain-containing protein [Planctomycetota bacterium]
MLFPVLVGAALAAPSATSPEATDLAATSIAGLSTSVLQEAAEEEDGPDGLWHGALNVGLSRSEGNADVENYSIDARGVQEFESHRWTLEALWYMARDNDRDEDDRAFLQRRALGGAKYDQFIDEKTYAYGSGFLETNFAARLDLRWSIGGGVGHQWRDDDHWKINTEIGLAYFDEEFDNGDEVDYIAIRAAWDIWTQVTETLTFGHFAEFFPSLDDADDIYGRATTYFEALISESMTARLSWVAVYDNTPTVDGDGNRLERLDNLYLLTVGWVF